MKKITIVVGLLIIFLVAVIALFWPRSAKLTNISSVQLSGVAGTKFTGFYVREGQRVDVSEVLPWSLDKAITEFEFRKVHPDETLGIAVRYGEAGRPQGSYSTEVGAGFAGIRGRVQDGGLAAAPFKQ